MKDKNKLIKKLETINADTFFKFLDAKKVTRICPMCHSVGEQVIAETSKAAVADLLHGQSVSKTFVTFFRHAPEQPTDSDANYYYKLSCDNCGYITTHEVRSVLHWLSQQEKGSHDE
ncbi:MULTISPECIES: hypothetical protein [Photorhabdus]|uniref:Uncharacterized protein n=1 Tax=Photorhabdus namnaonensis TaxID=1851568 RepID=A0A1B8YNU6_9GAMM|nr:MULTISPECIES: hypothetical protein [Photorhabdus]KGM26183.1 hypothetical protein KS18_22355 [Photorhabdus luminescens]MBS9429078.1 hypothetical protein [Photorhabdus akhurstii]MBS9436861.1 hypothetical protein [Photorhabdus noenieputensis]MCC8458626.1 hypothetical protein [Photorhabdus aegyptia]MCK3671554.1 hypothetical protein [Photorhabdus noenieputensis]